MCALIPASAQQPAEAQGESGHAVELRQVRRPWRPESHAPPTGLQGNSSWEIFVCVRRKRKGGLDTVGTGKSDLAKQTRGL